jgi:hypothetical protein
VKEWEQAKSTREEAGKGSQRRRQRSAQQMDGLALLSANKGG